LPPLLRLAPSFTRRRGIVRASGKAVVDDDGLFHPLGVTMFWAYQGWTRDRERFKRNIEFLRPYDYDHVRVLCEVGWAGWDIQPSDPDYERAWGELIDYLYDENGLRVELCLMGGDTGHDPMDVCAKIALVINANRAHKVMGLEMTNEWHIELRTQIEMCRYMRGETEVQLVALTSPGDVPALLSAFADAHATEFTIHTDRDNPDGRGWRQVRQGHDLSSFPGVVNSNEPPGVDRAYGAVNGNVFVEVINGVLKFATLIARDRCHVEAVDPASSAVTILRNLGPNDAWILPGDQDASLAYIVNGIYL
jgi:hypothetical protein